MDTDPRSIHQLPGLSLRNLVLTSLQTCQTNTRTHTPWSFAHLVTIPQAQAQVLQNLRPIARSRTF